jgi:RimJ/RimL family protein N-acetyltransferase
MILQTSRLVLRPWKSIDLSPLVEMNSEPEVYELLGGPGLAAHSAAALERYQMNFAEHGWGVFVIEHQTEGFLGLAGLQKVRDILPIAPAVEVVWRLRRSAWGQGYAHEAIDAILDSVRDHTAFSEIIAIISKPNERSARTAQRLGFRHDEEADFLYPDPELAAELRPHKIFRLSWGIDIRR